MRSKRYGEGLSVQDILNLDTRKLTDDQLRAVTTRLASAANKRIRRMEKAGTESPALKNVKRSGGDFSTKGKDAKGIRSEFKRAKGFLQSKTSSLRGYKKVKTASPKRKAKTPRTTTKDLLQIDTSRYKQDDLKKYARRIFSIANRRLKRLIDSGESTPALSGLARSMGFDPAFFDYDDVKFTVKGKSLNQLRSDLKDARAFLNNETSTITGWKKVKNKTLSALSAEGVNLTDENWDLFWKSYEKLKEIDPSVAIRGLKYPVQAEVLKEVEGKKDPEEIALKVAGRIAEIYEEEQELINDSSKGVSMFFE